MRPARISSISVICKYIALFVHDLHGAEDFYRRVFSMDLLFREGKGNLGQEDWGTLPLDKDWEDAEAAGIGLSMVALRRDDFVLALFQGTPQAGTVLEFCFGLAADEIEAVRARLPGDATILEHREGFLDFEDSFGFHWKLQEPDRAFRSSGELRGRWLPV